jgi:hypothetical protein
MMKFFRPNLNKGPRPIFIGAHISAVMSVLLFLPVDGMEVLDRSDVTQVLCFR